MTKKKLEELLAKGAITQEEYDELIKTAKDDEPDDKPGNDPEPKGLTAEEIEKMIQSSVDRATNKLGNENKKLREQLEKLQKEKLSDEERAELERKERETDLADRERALREKENRLYAIKAIKKAGLDEGSDAALFDSLVDFMTAEDETAIDTRVDAFNKLFRAMVKQEVDKTFKQNGGTPGKGSEGGNANNPYSKEHFNLTEQMKLEIENPELAKKLKALATK